MFLNPSTLWGLTGFGAKSHTTTTRSSIVVLLSVGWCSNVPPRLSCRASSHAHLYCVSLPQGKDRAVAKRAHAAGHTLLALLHPLMTTQVCLNIHTNTTQFHGQIISSTACALQLVLPLRSLPACVQDTAGVVHCSYPATAQCNDNTFIYQSEMRLQEVAPKAPFILGPA